MVEKNNDIIEIKLSPEMIEYMRLIEQQMLAFLKYCTETSGITEEQQGVPAPRDHQKI